MTNKMRGAEFAILANRIDGIVRKMSNTLMRTGRSGVLNRAADFSCCIVTWDEYLLSAAESLPIHVLAGPDIMAGWLKEYHPDMKPGDAYLNNSPYHGCSHSADHTLIVPVFDDEGRGRYFVMAKAHQADIGNSVPTTYHATAKDVYEEGALIFPCVKVQENYKSNQDFIRTCEQRIRVPDQWKGDFMAMVGAARIGEDEIIALGAEIGWAHLDEFVKAWFDYSENRMQKSISKMSSGSAIGACSHDHFPGTPEEGVEIKAKVLIESDEGKICVDLTDNIDCLPCGLNVSEACSLTASMVGIFNSVEADIPKNAGSFRRIEVLLRDNCVVGRPEHPTSCSVATTNIADRVANAVQLAISNISGHHGMAEVGALIPPAHGIVSGIDPRNGRRYINQIFLVHTAGAANSKGDAWLTQNHAGNGGLCFIDSVELAEMHHPIRIDKREILTDSEAPGKYKGAPAAICVFGPVNCDMKLNYAADGVVHKPKGICGGGQGHGNQQFLLSVDGEKSELPNIANMVVRNGERIISVSSGGGAYGSPLERNVNQVECDVADGLVSQERARAVYGVIFDNLGAVDEQATVNRRKVLSN